MGDSQFNATFIVVSGGHAVQAMKLAERMDPYSNTSFIYFHDNIAIRNRLPHGENTYKVTHTFQQVREQRWFSVVTRCWRIVPALYQSWQAFNKFNTDVVISTGSGPALVPMLAAKLKRKKIIFVESVSRIHSTSLSGRLAYLFLADHFFVQWPETKQMYPKATYAGRLL